MRHIPGVSITVYCAQSSQTRALQRPGHGCGAGHTDHNSGQQPVEGVQHIVWQGWLRRCAFSGGGARLLHETNGALQSSDVLAGVAFMTYGEALLSHRSNHRTTEATSQPKSRQPPQHCCNSSINSSHLNHNHCHGNSHGAAAATQQ